MLEIEHVTWKTINKIRKIRNECSQFMTNNPNKISLYSQIKWFINLPENLTPYIFYKEGIPVGYGIIKINDNRALLTGGIKENSRGLGLGKELFSLLIYESEKLDKTPTLDVLKTNKRAINLYSSLGFKVIKEEQGIYVMEKND